MTLDRPWTGFRTPRFPTPWLFSGPRVIHRSVARSCSKRSAWSIWRATTSAGKAAHPSSCGPMYPLSDQVITTRVSGHGESSTQTECLAYAEAPAVAPRRWGISRSNRAGQYYYCLSIVLLFVPAGLEVAGVCMQRTSETGALRLPTPLSNQPDLLTLGSLPNLPV